MKRIEDYRGIVDDEILADLHRRAARLFDRHVSEVNSTAYGGGVAELLSSLVPLMNDAGLKSEWRVLVGDSDFFGVTKKFHNALQGAELNLTARKKDVYRTTNESFSQYTHMSHADAIVIHDPQPLPLVSFYRKRQPWVWRCHIDLSAPHPDLWHYLKGFILRYDLVVVSHESYKRADLPVSQQVVHPAIDPLSRKNMELAPSRCRRLLQRARIPVDKPLVTQVSRFDRWKDPVGLVHAFKSVRRNNDCRLVLAGNTAMDDPESAEVLASVRRVAADLIESGDVVLLLGANDVTINALQRASAVVVQNSLREGFGLTVAEAMWKGRPVVATSVGGIPLQLRDRQDGYLVAPGQIDATAGAIASLLEDPNRADALGSSGREHVRNDFLVTRLLGHWLALIAEVLEGEHAT